MSRLTRVRTWWWRDSTIGGQSDQLSIHLDAAAGGYVISDPTRAIVSDIVGSTGSGSQSVFVPVTAATGDKIVVATGLGDDAVHVDWANGLGSKSLIIDGGDGRDSVTIVGGSIDAVSYQFEADGTTQIKAISGLEGMAHRSGRH